MEKKIEESGKPVEKIDCEVHGRCSSMEFSVDEEVIGRYCFRCYNDFLSKNLKNHVGGKDEEILKIKEILDDFEKEVYRVDKQPITKKTCIDYITLLRELEL